LDTVVTEKEKKAYKSRIGIKAGPVIGVIARLSPVKGHKYLLMAVKELLKQYPRLEVLIIGDGPAKKELVELTMSSDLGRCTFIEESTIDTRIPLSIMDVFVLPSVQEGLGLSVLEAMAAGVPVVASNVGGVYSLIKDAETGFLVPPKDPVALANAISRMLADKKSALAMANTAREKVKEKFSLQDMAERVEAVYNECKAHIDR